jgi:hypothetical protein
MARRATLDAADLALEQDRGQRPQLAPDLVRELGDGERARRFLGS